MRWPRLAAILAFSAWLTVPVSVDAQIGGIQGVQPQTRAGPPVGDSLDAVPPGSSGPVIRQTYLP